jgi:hypothetical protein
MDFTQFGPRIEPGKVRDTAANALRDNLQVETWGDGEGGAKLFSSVKLLEVGDSPGANYEAALSCGLGNSLEHGNRVSGLDRDLNVLNSGVPGSLGKAQRLGERQAP